MQDPVAIALKFGFLAVLYLFLLFAVLLLEHGFGIRGGSFVFLWAS